VGGYGLLVRVRQRVGGQHRIWGFRELRWLMILPYVRYEQSVSAFVVVRLVRDLVPTLCET
jgi:hypothetical protein